MSKQNGTTDGKGSSKDLFTGNIPHDSKRISPKRVNTVNSVMRALRTKKNVAQVVIPIPGGDTTKTVIVFTPGALGKNLLGGVDSLVTHHGYGKKIIPQVEFNALVKAKKIVPFVALKDATDD